MTTSEPEKSADQTASWPVLDESTPSVPSRAQDPRPGALRASDADREKVAAVLSTAYAEGRLTHEEHDERLELAMSARTFEQLVPLTDDLVPLDRPIPVPVDPNAPGPQIQPRTDAGIDQLVAVFGGFERKGVWHPKKMANAYTVFGGGEIDLTEAVWPAREIEITAVCAFGGLEITVPEGVHVRNEVVGIFGGSEVKRVTAGPEAPTLVVKGFAFFGGVEVRGPKPPKRRRGH